MKLEGNLEKKLSILAPKHTIIDIDKSMRNFNCRLDIAKQVVNKPEDRLEKIVQNVS